MRSEFKQTLIKAAPIAVPLKVLILSCEDLPWTILGCAALHVAFCRLALWVAQSANSRIFRDFEGSEKFEA